MELQLIRTLHRTTHTRNTIFMDILASYLLRQTSVRDYITFDQFKQGYGSVNQRLLRDVYQQLVALDEARHERVGDALSQFEQALDEIKQQNEAISESTTQSTVVDPTQLDKLADRLLQLLDEREVSTSMAIEGLKRQIDARVDALNDLRYMNAESERAIENTRKEIEELTVLLEGKVQGARETSKSIS